MGRGNPVVRCASMIDITLDNQKCVFDVDDLKYLTYFDTMFSKRWFKRGRNNKHIKPFSNDSEINAHSINCRDLKQLIIFAKTKSLSLNMKPVVASLDRLVEASVFFNAERIIDTSVLIEYFKNVKPGLTAKIRNDIINNSNNNVVINAMVEFNNEIQHQKENFINEMINNVDNIRNIKGIQLTNGVCLRLFHESFILAVDEQKNDTIKVNLVDKKKTEFILRFWKNASFKLAHNGIPIKCQALLPLIKCLNKNTCVINNISTSEQLYHIIDSMFEETLSEMMKLKLKRHYDNNEFDMVKLIIAKYKFTNETQHMYYSDYDESFSLYINFLTSKEIEQVSELILGTFDNYYDILDRNAINDEDGKRAMESMYELIISYLCHCSNDYIVTNAVKWFPILIRSTKYHSKTEIINKKFNKLINNMSTEHQVSFAMYLVNFFIFEYEGNINKFQKSYFAFSNKILGISWDITV